MDSANKILSVSDAAFELKLPTPLRNDLSTALSRQIDQAISVVEQDTHRVLLDRTITHWVACPDRRDEPVKLLQSDIQTIQSVSYWSADDDPGANPNRTTPFGRLTPLYADSPRLGQCLWPPVGGWPVNAKTLQVAANCGMTTVLSGAELNTARRAVVLALLDIYGGFPTQSNAFRSICDRIRQRTYGRSVPSNKAP